jgi:hypothetical protein
LKQTPNSKPGTTVTIVNGPLAGLGPIFKAHDGEARSIILLELLGKTRQLKIDRNHFLSTPQIRNRMVMTQRAQSCCVLSLKIFSASFASLR